MRDWLRRMLRLFLRPVLLTALVGVVLVSLPPLARFSFDLSHRIPFRPAPSFTNDVAIILANEHTVIALSDGRGRIHWAHHIRLLDRLTRDRARLVFFDYIFSETNAEPFLHQQLAAAIRRHGAVALVELATRHGAVEQITPLVPAIGQAAAAKGPGHLEGRVVRHLPGEFAGERSATAAAAALLRPDGSPSGSLPAHPRWLHYYGAPPTAGLPVFPYEDVLSNDRVLTNFYHPGFFAGKIVFVGQASPAAGTNNLKDTSQTPYSRFGGPPAPGIIVHATALLNLDRGDSLREIPISVQWLAAVVWAVLLSLLLLNLRCCAWPVPVLSALAAAIALCAVSCAVQWEARWWWSWVGPVAGQTGFALMGIFRWWRCELPYLAFFSYRTNEQGHLALMMDGELRRRGYRVRIDVNYLGAGRLEEQILRNIEQSRFFIPILSPGCLAACRKPGSAPDCENPEDWMLKELKHALLHGKTILPVFTRNFSFATDPTIPDLPALRELKKFKGVEHHHNDPAGFLSQLIQFLTGRRRE